ncbi:hypothetical protein QBC45DRAFT_337216, partial [Copromyces sp. CBS 386.78]
ELGPPRAKVAPRTDRSQTKSGSFWQFGLASPDLPHRAACPGTLLDKSSPSSSAS